MDLYQVIVIGAGISGLSACVKLRHLGINKILLLEANNRLGGRIHTIEFENSYFEMGAQWIHGTKGNPIYELAKSIDNIDDKKKKNDLVYYSSQDGQSIDSDFVEDIYDKLDNIFDNLDDMIENELDDDSDESLGKLLDDGFHKIIKKLKNKPTFDIELLKAIYKARLNEEKYESSCDDLYKLSALGWNEYEDFDGEQFTRLKFGYRKLIEHLASQLEKGSIRLNERVENINWSDEKCAVVKCFNDEKNEQSIFQSTCVLCTIPLGCLKRNHPSLFTPNLPAEKIQCIERIGFGNLNKLFTVFEKPVLNRNVEGLQIFWREDFVDSVLDESVEKWNLRNNKFYMSIDNFEVLLNQPNVLVSFVVGEDSRFIEQLDEQCLIDVIHELLRKCFRNLTFPRPKRVFKSTWASNEFFGGSYSFIKKGAKCRDTKVLASTLNNVLFFAGEATKSKYIGTAHGAYITGIEAANKITKVILKN